MKIRTIILAMLIAAAVISTVSLTAFASSGVNDIKGVTSEASSSELYDSANQNLKDIAAGLRDSLDSQMELQYQMVKSWAQSPAIINAAREAQGYSLEELYEMWSEKSTREYADGEAIGDGNAGNDLAPELSEYLRNMTDTTSFSEIFITDNRGYAIAASGATGDFDQGPDDWRVFLENGAPVFKKHKPAEGGEDWYRETSKSLFGFYIGEVEYDDSALVYGMDVVSRIKDSETNKYLGQIKAVFNYSDFVTQFTNSHGVKIYEIKVIDRDGNIIATSMLDKSKVNDTDSNLKNASFFKAVEGGSVTGFVQNSEVDENGTEVYAGYAASLDENGHIIVVTKTATAINAPITAFVSNLGGAIGDRSADLQRNMWIVGGLVALVIVAAAVFVIRAKISHPLQKLTDVSISLSQGDIDGLELDVRGKDEIGQLGESFQGVFAAFNFLKEQAEAKGAETREKVTR